AARNSNVVASGLRRRGRDKLLENSQIGRRQPGDSIQYRESLGGRRLNRARAACLAELGPLVHPQEKQLVLQNRPPSVAAEAPVVETRIGVRVADTRIAGNALCFLLGVEGIQVTVEDKTVGRTVERICVALGYGDELSASRTSELRLVLVRQERELRHCF